MTQEEIIHAFEDAMKLDFNFANNTAEHRFSLRHRFRMRKLFKSIDRQNSASFKSRYRTVLATVLILIAIITATTQAKAIYEGLVNLIITIYETFTDVHFEGDTTAGISTEYEITFVPDSFNLTDTDKSNSMIYYKYQNASGNVIAFAQAITKGGALWIDNEQGNINRIYVSGMEIILYQSEAAISANWIQDNYLMSIDWLGNPDEAAIIKIIESIQPVAEDNSAYATLE